MLRVLWNLSKNRGHECHLLSLEASGSRRKVTGPGPSAALPRAKQGLRWSNLGRDSSKGGADSSIFAFSKKRSGTRCFFGPARVQEVRRDSTGTGCGQGDKVTPSSGSPGAGISLSSQHRGCPRLPAAPRPLSQPSSPCPQCHTGQGKSSPRVDFPPCTSAFIQSCSAHPHSWLRDRPGITPSSSPPAQARWNLAVLVKARGGDSSQPEPALHSSGRSWQRRSPGIRSLWFLPLPSATAVFHRQPHTPCTSVGTQQFTFTSG